MASIRCVLQNEEGMIKILFSKHVRIANYNETVFLAIKEAFLIFVASKLISSYRLLMESDSINGMRWVKKLSSTPWRLCSNMRFIEFAMSNIAS